MEVTLVSKNRINQIVLTPENDHEKVILRLIHSSQVEATLKVGNFTECKGGWIRCFSPAVPMYGVNENDIDSLMVVLKPKDEKVKE